MKKFVITVPTLGAGGMERAVINIASEIIQQGYECYIYVLCGGDIMYSLPTGVKVIRGNKNPKNKLGILWSFFKFRKLYKKISPYCVLSFTIKYSTYIMLALIGLKTNVFVLHRSSPYITYGIVNNALSMHLFKKVSALVVQTHFTYNVFREKYKTDKIFIFPNPVRKLPSYNVEQTENIIISAGRLIKGKGFADLINIYRTLNTSQWKLMILGDGPERENLLMLIKEYNLEGKVQLLGFTHDIDRYLTKAKIFAFASKSEGFPNALLEAMCMGIPCISYDCMTGPSDIIRHGINGFLVKLDDQDSYREYLQILIENEELRNKFSIEARKLNEIHAPNIIISEFLRNVDLYTTKN